MEATEIPQKKDVSCWRCLCKTFEARKYVTEGKDPDFLILECTSCDSDIAYVLVPE